MQSFSRKFLTNTPKFQIILPSVDALIYFDADSIILSNLTQIWARFSTMESSNLVGVAEMAEFPSTTWFQKHNEFPHGLWKRGLKRGLNTGISLMNLKSMRKENFTGLIEQVRKDYEHLRPHESGDQFLQNILYSFHPGILSNFCQCKYPIFNLKFHFLKTVTKHMTK
jgi:UDP-xylose:glucoside alpha-1,3-xylosyltransferase